VDGGSDEKPKQENQNSRGPGQLEQTATRQHSAAEEKDVSHPNRKRGSTDRKAGSLYVLGFYVDEEYDHPGSYDSMIERSQQISAIVPFWYKLLPERGWEVEEYHPYQGFTPPWVIRGIVGKADEENIQVLMLVHNLLYRGQANGKELARQLLANEDTRRAFIDSVEGLARNVYFLKQKLLNKDKLRQGLKNIEDVKIIKSMNPHFNFEKGRGRLKSHFGSSTAKTARVSLNNKGVVYTLIGARPVPPVVRDREIIYKNILPHVDLQYIVATNGLKENIILKKYVNKPVFSFKLELEGVYPEKEGNQVIFYNQTTRWPLFRIPPPFMVDSSGAVSTEIAINLEKGEEGYIITFIPDEEWLKDPSRVYPVIIDPTTELWPGHLGLEPYWAYFSLDVDDIGEIKVNLYNGNLVFIYNDEYFVGQGEPTYFNRIYNSQAEINGIIGYNWVHNYYGYILENPDGSVNYTDEDGTEFVFTQNADGTYNRPPGVYKDLSKITEDGVTYFLLEDIKSHTKEYYDLYGNLTKVVDSNGNTSVFSYQDGVLRSVTDASNQVTTFDTSQIDNGIVNITDPAGRTVQYSRDSYGNLISTTNPEGVTVTFGYDAPNNLLTSITDGKGNTTTIAYDSEGRVSSITDADGKTTSFTYDPVNNTTVIITPRGESYTYTFNDRGNSTSLAEPGNLVTTYTWDDNNNLISSTDPNGNTTTYTYDASGNLLSYTTPDNKTTTFEYDANNNLIRATDPEQASVTLTYDASNNLTSVTDSAGSSTGLEYDQNGNNTAITDGNGNTTYYSYDDKGNLIQVTDALGGITTYTYDASNNLTSVRITKDGTTYFSASYSYDSLDRLISVTDAKGQTTTNSYDDNGNLIEVLYPNGNKINYTYTPTNRIASIAHNGVTQYQFTYDDNGNPVSITQPGEVNPFTFTYNDQNRLVQSREPNGNTVDYSYDDAENITGITLTVARAVYQSHYTYDANDRVTSITEYGNNTLNFSYGANDRLNSLVYPNGIQEDISYDAANKVTEVKHSTTSGTVILQENYTYDGEGNKLTVTDKNNKTVQYTYDALNRLTSETDPYTGEKTVYEYDPAGNRTKKTVYNPDGTVKETTVYTYNQANELVDVNGITYSYDANGNLTGDGKRTYIWDAENRLVEVRDVSTGQLIASFTYDGQGRRLSMTTPEGTTYYHYAGDRVAYQTDQNGNITLMFTYNGAGIPLTMRYNGKTYFYHTNDRGDVLAITDEQGSIAASYRYDAWGNILEKSGPLADINPYRYAGYRYDEATGLYYLVNRYYDPELGRFISRDIILGEPKASQTLNLYVYTKNNPVKFTDPDGRWVWAAAGAVTGAAAGAYAGYRLAKKRGWRGWKRRLAIAGGAVAGAAIGAVSGHYIGKAVRTIRFINQGSRGWRFVNTRTGKSLLQLDRKHHFYRGKKLGRHIGIGRFHFTYSRKPWP